MLQEAEPPRTCFRNRGIGLEISRWTPEEEPLSSSTTDTTGLGSNLASATYSAVLLPQTKPTAAPLRRARSKRDSTGGSISFSQGILQVTVTGASPSTAYVVADSESTVMDSSGTEGVGTGFTTDASGDGSMTTTSSQATYFKSRRTPEPRPDSWLGLPCRAARRADYLSLLSRFGNCFSQSVKRLSRSNVCNETRIVPFPSLRQRSSPTTPTLFFPRISRTPSISVISAVRSTKAFRTRTRVPSINMRERKTVAR